MLLRKMPNRSTLRVLVHGLYHCGRMFSDWMRGSDWDFRYYPDAGLRNLAAMARNLAACDLVYQIGGRRQAGRFLHAARLLRKKKVVMHWIGSDTLEEQKYHANSKASPWILQEVHHWAVSHWLVKEVQLLGVRCELVPIPPSFVPEVPSALPSRFSVLVYMPDVRRSYLYGLDRILQVARELPQISFELVGLVYGSIQDPPPNLKIHGRIPNLFEFHQRATVVWRPVRHDGLSSMVLEALGHGRHVLWSYPFPGCVQVTSSVEARVEISRLYALHQQKQLQVNWAGPLAINAGGYRPHHLKQDILRRLQYIHEH